MEPVRAFLLLLLTVAALQTRAFAEEQRSVAIAAAADLTFCLEELTAAFRKMHPEAKVQATVGATGNLFAQITRGAPFDVFMAADVQYPKQLIQDGGADPSTLRIYAIGHLVLWTTKTNVDVSRGLEVLKLPQVRKVGIANPAHAPYGRAAQAALESAGIWAGLQKKLVLGENVAQTAQFVQTGNVDAGIVSLSVVRSPKLAGQGSYFEIPESAHPRLEQAVVLTKRGAGNPLARRFLEFLQSPEARTVFDRYGFLPPPKSPGAP